MAPKQLALAILLVFNFSVESDARTRCLNSNTDGQHGYTQKNECKHAKYTLASLGVQIGSIKAYFHLGSDDPNMKSSNIPDFSKQMQAINDLPVETKKQLHAMTRGVLDAFGLYEPFKESKRYMVVNNPVYQGEKSGMVSYKASKILTTSKEASGKDKEGKL